ncbi:MAG: hypothetical protein J6Q29_04210 [Alistipes sp.]|nr:hypothetical protein [Alistipes sp.]
MGLSSNILWHQTNHYGFREILKTRQLKCSYCLETFLQEQGVKVGFPMISLSDIPLADISEYLDQYDGYLFGFSREWVIKNNFNPVWYCEKTNLATTQHKKMIFDKLKRKGQVDDNIVKLLFYYGAYMKDIEGELEVKSKNLKYKKYRFYDEREYRYVPDYNVLLAKGLDQYLTPEEYDNYKATNGNTLINISLPFSYDDLKVIIVKTENQVRIWKRLLKHTDIHIFSHNEIKQSIIGIGHQIEGERLHKK